MLEALIRKYDRPVPRYTSYPTALQFHAGIGPAQEHAWLEQVPDGERISLYLHVPFCARLCRYCGCHTSVTSRRAPVERYRDQLAAEIDLVAERLGRRQPVAQIHWGGGTPNLLTADDLLRVSERLERRFLVDAATEIAVEIDPRALAFEHLAAFAWIGIKRASLGVQDFDPAVQVAIDRVQPHSLVAEAVDHLPLPALPASISTCCMACRCRRRRASRAPPPRRPSSSPTALRSSAMPTCPG